MLLQCYRTGDAADPEAYMTGIASVLCTYPRDAIDHVTDPRWGLQTRMKWMPAPAEIREACEAFMAPIRAREARDRQARETARLLGGAIAKPPEAERRAHVERRLGPRSAPVAPVTGEAFVPQRIRTIAELDAHNSARAAAARKRCAEALEAIAISEPAK